MIITHRENPEDPACPIMHGSKPFSKEFNRRQAALLKEGRQKDVNFENITTVILEILIDDYDKRHAPRKKKK